MRLSPDGLRMLYIRSKDYKITRKDGTQRDSTGFKLILRDLKTGKDTPVPIPALSGHYIELTWMSMTVFDPTGRTLIVPVGQDGNKNGLMEITEKYKPGLYDIASRKLTALDVEGNMIFPTFHPNGKTLVVMSMKGDHDLADVKVHVTPSDKTKLRVLGKGGLIRSICPTSGIMPMMLLTEGERPQPDKYVLYDLKTDTVKSDLVDRDQGGRLSRFNPQWTEDGRYLHYLTVKEEQRDGRVHTEAVTRIWDAKTGKEVGVLSGVAPIGAGPGKSTMVLDRPLTWPWGNLPAEPGIYLHSQGDKGLGHKLHRLGDAATYPLSTQGKWLLFIREDSLEVQRAKRVKGSGKVCLAEIVLPKK
jgi:hypothetical protein